MGVALIGENARSLDFARDENFTGVGGTAEAVPSPNLYTQSDVACSDGKGSDGSLGAARSREMGTQVAYASRPSPRALR
jgi:hypothetical protein